MYLNRGTLYRHRILWGFSSLRNTEVISMQSYKIIIFFLMFKTCPDGFGEILESCIFHRTIITWRDHKQFCLKSAKRLGNTSGYSSATGYSFRICKGQSRSCKSMKGVKPHHTHPSMQGRCHPFFFFFVKNLTKKTLSEMRKHFLKICFQPVDWRTATARPSTCPLSTYRLLIYLNFCFQSAFLQMHKITKLDPSLILPFYSWFQISNVRGSF